MSRLDRLLLDRVQSLLDTLEYWCGLGRADAEKILIGVAAVLAAINLASMWSDNISLDLLGVASWGIAIYVMQHMHRTPGKARKNNAPTDATLRVGMVLLSGVMLIGALVVSSQYQNGLFFLFAGDGLLAFFFYVYIADEERGFRARAPLPHLI